MPNWCHNTLTVSGESDELMKFVEAAKPKEENYRQQYDEMWVPEGEEKPSWEKWWSLISDNQPLSFESLFPQPPEEELKKLETLVPCTMCGAHGELPESPEQAEERGAKWYEWMDPETREDRTCNSCQGTKKERQLGTYEGWYSWRLENWGTKWDASFDGPFMALMTHDDADLDVSVETQGATVTPTVAVYKFDTAWGPPVPFVGGASERFKELEFVLRFGEPGNGFAGEVKYVAGVCMHDEELEVEEVLAPEEMWF